MILVEFYRLYGGLLFLSFVGVFFSLLAAVVLLPFTSVANGIVVGSVINFLIATAVTYIHFPKREKLNIITLIIVFCISVIGLLMLSTSYFSSQSPNSYLTKSLIFSLFFINHGVILIAHFLSFFMKQREH